MNGDGYWSDGSDFNLLLDSPRKFQALPHDLNEAFRARGNGAGPDPVVAMADTNKALRRRVLAIPALRKGYLGYVEDIAVKWLDWNRLGPMVERYRALIEPDVTRDTRKLTTNNSFRGAFRAAGDSTPATLRGFAARRRAALLEHQAVQGARRG